MFSQIDKDKWHETSAFTFSVHIGCYRHTDMAMYSHWIGKMLWKMQVGKWFTAWSGISRYIMSLVRHFLLCAPAKTFSQFQNFFFQRKKYSNSPRAEQGYLQNMISYQRLSEIQTFSHSTCLEYCDRLLQLGEIRHFHICPILYENNLSMH